MAPRKKNVILSITQNMANQEAGGDVPPPAEAPKKRERKSKKQPVVAIVTPDGIQGSLTQDTKRPIIVHLPIHSSDVKFHDQPLIYDPTPPGQPEAFDASFIDPFSMEATYENLLSASPMGQQGGSSRTSAPFSESAETSEQNVLIKIEQPSHQTHQVHQGQATTKPRKEYTSGSILTAHCGTKKEFVLPEKTDVACFWCCDTPEGRPCILPQSVENDVWHVYGNFCTPQCALAYLLSEHLDTHVRWERIALLNRLYGSQCNGRVYPAPNRETLKRFGGPIDIRDFRSLCDDQRVRVDVHMPPMVSILASMDTKPIDFYEAPIRTNYNAHLFAAIGPSDDKQDTGLKLKRSKPLKSKDSTLDACLQIQVKTRGDRTTQGGK